MPAAAEAEDQPSAGDVVDVGSGGGSPGIPLAVTLPAREFTLLESERRKCRFLEAVAVELPNVYRYAWVSSRGEYALSDSAGFNPNLGSTVEWRLLRPGG